MLILLLTYSQDADLMPVKYRGTTCYPVCAQEELSARCSPSSCPSNQRRVRVSNWTSVPNFRPRWSCCGPLPSFSESPTVSFPEHGALSESCLPPWALTELEALKLGEAREVRMVHWETFGHSLPSKFN